MTDYFSKWTEAIPLIEVKTSNMFNFIKHHVIHDNGPQFAIQAFYQFCNKYQIKNVASTAYNPIANGLAKAFNKTIFKLLKKFISSSKRDWNEKLSECLGRTEPWFEPRQAIRLLLQYTGVRQLYH